MSTIEVNKITPISGGTTVTLGNSGDTFNLASGATAGFGKIGQVVQHLQTAVFTLSAQNTWTDITGYTASITPTATTSKILVRVFGGVNHSTASSELYRLKLLRGSTAIGVVNSDNANNFHFWSGYGNSNTPFNFGCEVLDTPASTSSQTYKLQAYDTGSGTNVYVGGFGNAYNTLTGITLMEVLA
tara:strand:+ start:33 stop:590 length:558 start_codon:yes stop_codon:yes gene_type:complete